MKIPFHDPYVLYSLVTAVFMATPFVWAINWEWRNDGESVRTGENDGA